MRSSGGSREIGDFWCTSSNSSSGTAPISRYCPTPNDDCESLACSMKKSVSSSLGRSVEEEDSDSECGSLGRRSEGRER